MSREEFNELIEETKAAGEDLSALVTEGKRAMLESRFRDAERAFCLAHEKRPDEAYLVQQLVLAAYKGEEPSRVSALGRARGILEKLVPSESTDPETLGIAGAIHKNLFRATGEAAELDLAIEFYGRGFTIRRDYYNGENLALCLDERAVIQQDPSEVAFNRMAARKVRGAILNILSNLIKSSNFSDRSDRMWVFATLANCYFALKQPSLAEQHEQAFFAEGPNDWQTKTYEMGKAAAIRLASTIEN